MLACVRVKSENEFSSASVIAATGDLGDGSIKAVQSKLESVLACELTARQKGLVKKVLAEVQAEDQTLWQKAAAAAATSSAMALTECFQQSADRLDPDVPFCVTAAQRTASQKRQVEAGAVPTILAALQKHLQVESLQEQGCRAMSLLSFHNHNHRSLIGSNGGVATVLAAMRAHFNTKPVQLWGCRALGSLSFEHPDNQSLIGKAGGVDVIMTAMRTHAADDRISEWACVVICNLARDRSNQSLLGSSGGVQLIVGSMRMHESKEAVQEQGGRALSNLSWDHPANTSLIESCGGLQAIISARLTHGAGWWGKLGPFPKRTLTTIADYNMCVHAACENIGYNLGFPLLASPRLVSPEICVM
jgi:hypothetical protein